MDSAETPSLKKRLWNLYEGDTPAGHRFRYALLIFDLVTIAFVIATSFLQWNETEYVDAIIGVLLLLDFGARLWISRRPLRMVMSVYGIIDILVIVSMLAPIVGEGLAFLRVARVLRLLRSYTMVKRLRQDFPWFRKNEQVTMSALNLGNVSNADGSVTLEEFKASPRWKKNADKADEAFKKRDKDSDGKVTLEEFTAKAERPGKAEKPAKPAKEAPPAAPAEPKKA